MQPDQLGREPADERCSTYNPPKLTVLGTVAELTQADVAGTNDGSPSMSTL